MAVTPVGRKLTEAHRAAQVDISRKTVAAMRNAWPMLEPTNLANTFGRWFHTVEPVVIAGRQASSVAAASYVGALRNVELGGAGGFVPVLAEALNAEALRTSLLVTGPVGIRNAVANSVPLPVAMQRAEAATAAAGSRHALMGGRETIVRNVQLDRKAIGWQRITSAGSCAFCAMLASRGAVYLSGEGGTVDFKSHDGCHCMAEPIYARGQPLNATSAYYRQLWNESTKGTHGADSLNAFRRALEGGRTPVSKADLLRPAPVQAAKVAPARVVAARGVHPSEAVSAMAGPGTKVGKAARIALDEIAKVHRVPDGIAKVPVKASQSKTKYGHYSHRGAQPVDIAISNIGDHMQTTMAHEFGHYLDHQGNLFGQSAEGQVAEWGTTTPYAVNAAGRRVIPDLNPLLADFYAAVDASPTKIALVAERGQAARYYNSKVEVWARAYAQWIADRSGSAVMKEEVKAIRSAGGVRGLSQWAEDEFEPIAKTMDAIFKEAGLM